MLISQRLGSMPLETICQQPRRPIHPTSMSRSTASMHSRGVSSAWVLSTEQITPDDMHWVVSACCISRWHAAVPQPHACEAGAAVPQLGVLVATYNIMHGCAGDT
jgi:hypothetical protein